LIWFIIFTITEQYVRVKHGSSSKYTSAEPAPNKRRSYGIFLWFCIICKTMQNLKNIPYESLYIFYYTWQEREGIIILSFTMWKEMGKLRVILWCKTLNTFHLEYEIRNILLLSESAVTLLHIPLFELEDHFYNLFFALILLYFNVVSK